ncbi:MAG TPA: GNAT family N-acetyltransferase [Mycobacteriales bacterium]|nr:GNAT family N-acetyltransferase [Mycobacteriales bacterium]
MTVIEEIDPTTASEADLLAWCEISAYVDSEQRPGEVERPLESLRLYYVHPWANHVFRRWAARDESGRLVGWCEANWRVGPDNPRAVGFTVEVLPDHRRRRVATALLRPAIEHARTNGRDLVTVEAVRNSDGAAFLTAHGFAEKMVDRRSVLDLTSLDLDAVEKWGRPGDDVLASYELVQWRDACPEQLVEELALLRTAMNDAPREQLEWDDETWTPEMVRNSAAVSAARGDQAWTTCVRHLESGRLIALTDVVGPAAWDEWAFQEDTVVLADHRGHGLGRWIKAANVAYLLADRPSTKAIETWNAGSNRWMLAINDELGFVPATWWAEFQVDLDILEQSLRL